MSSELPKTYDIIVAPGPNQDVAEAINEINRTTGLDIAYIAGHDDGTHSIAFTIDQYSHHQPNATAIRSAGFTDVTYSRGNIKAAV